MVLFMSMHSSACNASLVSFGMVVIVIFVNFVGIIFMVVGYVHLLLFVCNALKDTM